MDRQDATTQKPLKTLWKTRMSFVVVTIITISTCVAIRLLDGLQTADAQRQKSQSVKASSSATASSETTPPTQNVVAVINGKPIYRKDLAHECLKRFGEDTLESLVNKTLLLDECKKQKVSVSREEVEKEIESMATRFGLPKARWLEMLKQERDISPAQYRSDIIWPTLALQKLGAQSLQISEHEIHEAYESQYGAKVSVRLIAVTQREKAEQIHQIASGDPEKFASLAMDHSEDTNSAAYGGIVPPIRRYMGNRELETAAFALKEGEISSIISIANQFIILKCQKHLPPASVSRQDMKTVRTKLEERIARQKEREVAAETFERIQQAASPQLILNDPARRQRMPGVAAIIGGKQITVRHLAEACVERHGAEALESEINRRLLKQELQHKQATIEKSDINQEIERAARAFGITTSDGSADVDRWLKMVTEKEGVTPEIYITDVVWPTVALKKLLDDGIVVTKEDLRKGFESNYGTRIECLAIVLSDQRRAAKVHREALETNSDNHFGQLASVYSIEPVSRNNNGKIPPIARYSGQPHVEKQAFQLQPGEISPVIVSHDRFIILRCIGRTKPVTKDFAAVQDLLHEELLEKKLRVEMANLFDQIKEQAQIDNFLAKTSQSGKQRELAAATTAKSPQNGQPQARLPVTPNRPEPDNTNATAVRTPTKRR